MATPQESLQSLIASTLQLQESSRQVNVSLASVQETLVALAAGQTNVVARFDTFNGLMQTACGSFTRQADALVEAARIAKEDLDSRQRRGEKGTKSPTSFDGADKGWLGWSFQLETYFQNRNPGAEKVMREARVKVKVNTVKVTISRTLKLRNVYQNLEPTTKNLEPTTTFSNRLLQFRTDY